MTDRPRPWPAQAMTVEQATVKKIRRQLGLLSDMKRDAIERILQRLEPYFYESGFVRDHAGLRKPGEPARHVRVWRVGEKPWRLAANQQVEVEYLTEDGIVEDASGGGLVTCPWKRIPLGDLLRIELRIIARLDASAPGASQVFIEGDDST